ncbi:MAG: hypothetical protein HY763_05180 [Planctomycetes bacterium]|nr:hypothetical protein [Planctomycetota bacterium]
MLAEAADIRREGLPHQPTVCLEPRLVLEACREQFTRVGVQRRERWRTARMIEALYDPQRYLRVVYAFLDDADTPDRRLWPEGDLVYLHTPLRDPISRRGTALVLEGTTAEAYCFPNDRRLRGLRRFTRREAAARVWQEWLDPQGERYRIEPDSLQRLLVRYVPEQKWLARLRAERLDRRTGVSAPSRIAVRSAADAVCAALLNRHTALSEDTGSSSPAFRVPRVVGVRPAEALIGVEWIRGDSLVEVLAERDTEEVMRNVVARLRTLHDTHVGALPAVGPAEVAARCHDAISDLSITCPDLAPELHMLGGGLERRLRHVHAPCPATLHNDFHWNQLSIKRHDYTLLDLERMAEGDPLIDVANFATQLQMLGDRPELGIDPQTASGWRQAFLSEWARQDGQALDRPRFACYAALSRLELARGMMRHLRPGWRGLATRCLEQAGRDLYGAVPAEDGA